MSEKSFNYLLFLSPLFIVIIFMNSLIFVREAIYFILFYFIFMFLIYRNKLPHKILKNTLWIFIVSFIVYLSINTKYDKYGIIVILETGVMLAVFSLSVFLSIKGSYYKNAIWYLSTVYFWMFLVRSLVELEQLKYGYNLSTGLSLFSLLPLIGVGADNLTKRKVFYVSILCSLFILMYVGARQAVVSVLLFSFIVAMLNRNILSMQKKKVFIIFSVFVMISIISFYPLYIMLSTIEHVSWVGGDGGSSFNFFNKRIGTRLDIWKHLLYYISLDPLLGHGANLSTSMLQPTSLIEFNMNRDNLSSHSTYLEIIYRIGFLGLFLFLLIFYKIIKILSNNLHVWEVKIISAYVLSLLVYISTSVILVFDSNLNSIFIWIALGVGIGASLKGCPLKKMTKLR